MNTIKERYGRLTVIKRKVTSSKHRYYECTCECGKTTIARGTLLRTGKTISCGCLGNEKRSLRFSARLLGKTFGSLLVIQKLLKTDKRKNVYWLCVCRCGVLCESISSKLIRGIKQSCSCEGRKRQAEKLTIHGLSKTKEMLNFWGTKYRMQKKKATPKWADLSKIKDMYLNCPEGYAVDHIVPVQGKSVCGLHVENNLQYLTKKENSVKHNKFDSGY